MRYAIIVFFITLFTFFNSDTGLGGKVSRKKNPENIHIIAIGINAYNIDGFVPLKNSANDALSILKKVKEDAKKAFKSSKTISKTRGLSALKKDSAKIKEPEIFTHLLLNEDATLKNIRKAFKEVIKNSTTNDYFIFYFAGMTYEINKGQTILFPYSSKKNVAMKDFSSNYDYKSLEVMNLFELANFMNQIAAKNQIVISEAGVGKTFAQNLQSNLFEHDPDLALNSERNRVILTTIGVGQDSSSCNASHGPLMHYILISGNVFEVFNNYHYYEYSLNKSEVACSPKDTKYYYISQENDYKKLLAKRSTTKTQTRGSKGESLKKEAEETSIAKSETYALVIATNKYNENQQSWGNLKNPINDANAVADILASKYAVKVRKLYNEPKQNIIKEFIKLKQSINENDKLLVFIAGHGYYSENLSQGYIVTTDSQSLQDNISLPSYIPMSSLNSLLDKFKCKQILTVLDVCYGASFEMNDKDLSIENYSKTKFDNGIGEFIKETDKSISRIVLASGEGEVPDDFWDDNLDHSPFASKLIDAFESEKEFISPGKIYSYVRGNTTQPILKRFGQHESTGDFLLAVNN